MAQTMQGKMTAEFERTVTAAGLELVQAGSLANDGKGNAEVTWLAMDGLDTRLVITATFSTTRLGVKLGGEAVSDRPNSWFREHALFPKAGAVGGSRVTELSADYPDGRRVRRIFEVIAVLLAPHAWHSEAEAAEQLAGLGLTLKGGAEVAARARLNGSATATEATRLLATVTYAADKATGPRFQVKVA